MIAVAPQQYLTPHQVADELGVTYEKVIGWLNTKELVGRDIADRPGKKCRWRIRRADLEEFLDRRANKRPAPQPRRAKREPTEKSFY